MTIKITADDITAARAMLGVDGARFDRLEQMLEQRLAGIETMMEVLTGEKLRVADRREADAAKPQAENVALTEPQPTEVAPVDDLEAVAPELGIGGRALKALRNMGITTVEALAEVNISQFAEVPGAGPKAVEEVRRAKKQLNAPADAQETPQESQEQEPAPIPAEEPTSAADDSPTPEGTAVDRRAVNGVDKADVAEALQQAYHRLASVSNPQDATKKIAELFVDVTGDPSVRNLSSVPEALYGEVIEQANAL